MKKNKFIPIAILAGLCVLAVSMQNKQCSTESATTQYSSSSEDNGKTTKTMIKRTSKSDRKNKNYKNYHKNGRHYKG